jgi:hypothetical protein
LGNRWTPRECRPLLSKLPPYRPSGKVVCAGPGFGLGRALMTTANLRHGQDGSWNDEWLAHRRIVGWMLGSAFAFSLLVACVTALR